MIMPMQERAVSCRILHFGWGEAGFGGGIGEVVEGEGVDFRDASAEVAADEEFVAFEFGLEDYEAESGFGVCIAGLFFYEFDLGGVQRLHLYAGRREN